MSKPPNIDDETYRTLSDLAYQDQKTGDKLTELPGWEVLEGRKATDCPALMPSHSTTRRPSKQSFHTAVRRGVPLWTDLFPIL